MLDRSREQPRFYGHTLGLPLSPETIKNHLLFDCGDATTLLVYGRPAGSKADHTQVRFWSNDLEADVDGSSPAGWSSRTTTFRL